jgi:hypothetical protein
MNRELKVLSTPSKPPARAQAILSISLVSLSLLASVIFIMWYMKSAGASNTVKLSPEDLASMQTAGRQLNYQNNGVVPNTNGRFQPTFVAPAPPPPDLDRIENQVIRAGPVLVRVYATGPAGSIKLVFRQRSWGMLQDTPNFTIARRIVHEESLAKQLAITADQLSALQKIVASPPLKSTYLSALPVTDAEMAEAAAAWKAYVAAVISNNAANIDAATKAVLSAVGRIGSTALSRAREEYAAADRAITTVVDTRQIAAYRLGKSLTGP